MRKIWVMAAASLALAGCTQMRTVSHDPVKPPEVRADRRAPVARPPFERQIENAVDAGEGDPIVSELRRRVTVNPDDVKARLALVDSYNTKGFPELAIEHLRFAVARAPHLSDLSMRLARALHTAGETEGAIDVLTRFMEKDGRAPVELISLLGIYKDDLGMFKEAERLHRTAVELDPSKDAFHNNLGFNLLLQGRAAESVTEFRRAVALNPRSETARNNLGTALATMPGGDLKEAVLQWQSVSGPTAAHSNLAGILIEQKRYSEARSEIETALGYDRMNVAALSNLALLNGQGENVAVRVISRPNAWQRLSAGMRRAISGKADSEE